MIRYGTELTFHWYFLQAARPDVRNIPPLDVHWVWHCHMLSPIHYQQVRLFTIEDFPITYQ